MKKLLPTTLTISLLIIFTSQQAKAPVWRDPICRWNNTQYGLAEAVAGSCGIAYIGMGLNHLVQLDTLPWPECNNIHEHWAVSLSYVRDITVVNGYAYVAGDVGGFWVIPVDPNLGTPHNCQCGDAHGVAISGNYAYVADLPYGLHIIDISEPNNPHVVAYCHTTGGWANDVAVSGNYAYLTDGRYLQVIDVSNPKEPNVCKTFPTKSFERGIAISGNYAFLATDIGLEIINISAPCSPVDVSIYDTNDVARGVDVQGNYAYVADDTAGLAIIDISEPNNPRWVDGYDTEGRAYSVSVSDGYIYLTDTIEGLVIFRMGPEPEFYMFLKEPLSAEAVWTDMKGGGGNIENDIPSDIEEPKPDNPEGNYLGTKSGELSLITAGAHPEMAGETVTGQASKLGLGQPVEGDLISFIPVVSTIADIAEHWYSVPLESDKRRRYAATAMSGVIHIGECPQETADLSITVEMNGAASGQASYETHLLTWGGVNMVLSLVPTGAIMEIGSCSWVEAQIFKKVLGMGVNGAWGLSLDSRFRAFSELCLGLGEGSFYSIDYDPFDWTVLSSDFDKGIMYTSLLPSFWSKSEWLPKDSGKQGKSSTSTVYSYDPSEADSTRITVETGADLPLMILLRTYAETAGFAAAEATIDEFRITISAPNYPEVSPLVIQSDPEWSFPTFSRANPYFERSDLLAAGSANDLTYGDVSITDSVAGVNVPDGSAMVFVDCNSIGGVIVPVYLPEPQERRIKLNLDVFLSRCLDRNEHAELQVGLTNQSMHEILWSLDVNDVSVSDTPLVENGFTLHTGMIELNLDVSDFESGPAFLTLAGYVEPNDCDMGFIAYGLSIDPKFVLGDFDLDGDVDFTDFGTFANQWLKADCNEDNSWCQGCDFDEGSQVDFNDLDTFANTWLWSTHIPGDLDFTGHVNSTDFCIFATYWGADCDEPDWCDGCDFNKSGRVDVEDLREFVKYWLLATTP